MRQPIIIEGASHKDQRGRVTFTNGFDMTAVRRMYYIEPKDGNVIRAWQGHKEESKWFHCIKGSFIINIIKVDDWKVPSRELKVVEYRLHESSGGVLHIPGGYVNGFKALMEESILLVFSDFSLEDSLADDIRFDVNYWKCKWY